jgi:uncharacterized protein
MFLVHFKNYASEGAGLDAFYTKIVDLLFEERFWAMFGILFGVGFAIQFRRAEARGDRYVTKYIRRLAALAVFGFIAEAVFGFNVLLSYAIWGIPLLLFRNWSPRALIVAVVLSAASGSIYGIARTAYGVATRGEQAYKVEREALARRNASIREAFNTARDDPSYSKVFSAQLVHMRWFYAQPFSFLPVNTLTLFLLGLLALRVGIFDRPEEHRRLIVALMIFGVASWLIAIWLPGNPSANARSSLVAQEALARLGNGFGIIRPIWLTFAYMGGVLLLVAHNPQWLGRLALFGYTGRMALTNYMIQIALLDLIFTKHGLGVMITPLEGLGAAIGLFLIDAVLSKWWLERFRYGPLEWLWRSITYWKKAELRRDPTEGTISTTQLRPSG